MFKKIIILLISLYLCSTTAIADDFSDILGAENIAGSGLLTTSLTSPELQKYTIQLGKKIIENFEMPNTTENLSTIIIFKVDGKGKLLNYEISQSSGSKDYDTRVVNALKKSSPYQPPQFQVDEELTVILNMDLSIIKFIKMLTEDLDLNQLLLQMELQQQIPAVPQFEQPNRQPQGKKFVNPYEFE